MKFPALSVKLTVFYLISLSVCSNELSASAQSSQFTSVDNLKNLQTPPRVHTQPVSPLPANTEHPVNTCPFPFNGQPGIQAGPGFVNLSKGSAAHPVGANAPSALGRTSFVNKSKPATMAPSTVVQSNEQLVLQARDIGSFGPKWQSFSDYLTVPKGCEQMPFSLIFTNGPTSRFKDLRINLNGKPIGTIKDFNSQPTLVRNVTGSLSAGDNLLTLQALGPTGAKLNWKFATAKIVVTKVNPNSFAPTDKVTIEGRNFSDIPKATQVLIGDKAATVVSATNKSLQIKVPTGLLGGKTKLVVMIGSLKSNAIEVTLKGAPEIMGVDFISTSPGQPLTITGSGFSSVASENQVMIGPYEAEIKSVSPNSISVTVPIELDAMSPVYDLPIKVKTNGMESTDPTNSGKINIQSRVF